MKQWKGASLVLGTAALFVVGALGTRNANLPVIGNAPERSGAVGQAAPPGAAVARAVVRLPVMTNGDARPLSLTRSMLEHAWLEGHLHVALPDNRRYVVAMERQRIDPGGQWTVIGRVKTRLGAQAMILTFGPDAVFGVLPRPDGSLLQVTTSLGRTEITKAGGLLPPGSKGTIAASPDYLIPPDPEAVADKGVGNTHRLAAPFVPAAAELETRISVLALYSDDLVDLRGSVSAAETEVTNLFAIANQAHLDSGTRVQLDIATLRRVDVDPGLENRQALWALSDNRVPGIDLASLRDESAADLVALVRPHGDHEHNCGAGWLNGAHRSPELMSDQNGFSVSNVAPCGPYVLAHELAHNMGSAHDRDAETWTGELTYGAYGFSFGYHQDGPAAFGTIMAESPGKPWLGYFSNPLLQACGAKCGIEDVADNVRSLNATAGIVAAFRDPPGTLSIRDAEILEPEPGSNAELVFEVHLSGPAPAGGVQFNVSETGGTAQEGIDYLAKDIRYYAISEGDSSTIYVTRTVVGDALDEPDETIVLTLSDVVGATVNNGSAIGRIVNDDPRVSISGRVRFEEGVPPPDAPFLMTVQGYPDLGWEAMSVQLTPPEFAYEISAPYGATRHFSIEPPPPFATLPFTIKDVRYPLVRDIYLQKGIKVSGRVNPPAGATPLESPVHLQVHSSLDGQRQPLHYALLQPPDFAYSHWVVPGAWLSVEAEPPSPYERFSAVPNDVQEDTVQDIDLSTIPSLVIWGGGRWTVGGDGYRGAMQLLVELSAPAPEGGVRFRYNTVDGTAKDGSDYLGVQGTLEIPEGELRAHMDVIEVFGSSRAEGEEYFHVVVSDVSGANPVETSQRVTLALPVPAMSDPLPPMTQ